MKSIGFYSFAVSTPVVEQPIKTQVLALTAEKRIQLLNHFIMKSSVNHTARELGLTPALIEDVFDTIASIQERCRSLMRGEVIITPAVTHIDPETLQVVIDTPAVMNTPPTTKVALKTLVKDEYNDTFPNTFTGDVMEAMILWSNNGVGDFAFYKSHIIL